MSVDASEALPRPGPRPSTSRQEIVQCAVRMLDRDGAETLTFRAMARELGISAGALSRYFKNLADLQDEVAASVMSEVRPLDAASKTSLRDQLVRVGMDWLEINRVYPYLMTIRGPATATAIARHVGQCLKVLLQAGIDFERALAIFNMLLNLAYAWGVQDPNRADPALQATTMQAISEELGEFAPQLAKLASANDTGSAIYRRWFELFIDGLLPGKTSVAKGR